jgi:hypothetical protein
MEVLVYFGQQGLEVNYPAYSELKVRLKGEKTVRTTLKMCNRPQTKA